MPRTITDLAGLEALIASMLASPARETWALVSRLAEQEPEPVLEIPFP